MGCGMPGMGGGVMLGMAGIWPSVVKRMTPPHVQTHMLWLVRAGMLSTSIIGLPGCQGAVRAGMQGMGVSTPMAALVAEATVGLLSVLHMPKGMTFTMGLKSMMFAAVISPSCTMRPGSTTNAEGARPKVHVIIAPLHTYDSPIEVL